MSQSRGGTTSHWTKISAEELLAATGRYQPLVKPELADLEEERRSVIPDAIRRRKAKDGAFVEKSEMMRLVEWKSKQKATPYANKLISLAESNEEEQVKAISTEAFMKVDDEDPWKCVESLSKMKGIGPATASLMLSCYNPAELPFFSDPLFRWLHLEEARGDSLLGWDRAIKYNLKEYKSLCSRLGELRDRLEANGESIDAARVEQAAFVFHHEHAQQSLQEARSAKKRKANEHADDAETQLSTGTGAGQSVARSNRNAGQRSSKRLQ